MLCEVSICSKHNMLQLWNVFIALTSLAAVTLSLFELFFNSTIPQLVYTRYCFDSIFLLNIILCFFIGYETQSISKTDSEQVWRRYLKSWFVIDLLSVVPLETLRFPFPSLHFMHFNRCLRILHLFRIISNLNNELDTNKLYVTTLRSVSILVICAQVCACLWFNQACGGTYYNHPRECPKMQNWVNLIPELSTNLTSVSDWDYCIVTVFWSLITMTSVGYGELYALNANEAIVSSLVMVAGIVTYYGVIFIDFGSVVSNLDLQRGRLYHRVKMICIHMKNMGLEDEVKKMDCYNLWTYRSSSKVGELLDDLPYALRSDVSCASNKHMIEKLKLLHKTDDGFLKALSLKLNTERFIPGQILVSAGEMNQNAYYIRHGCVEVLGSNNEKIATLFSGSIIGEIYLLHKIPRHFTIRAVTVCDICILESNVLFSLFLDYPQAGHTIKTAARKRLHNIKLSVPEAIDTEVGSNQNIVFHMDLTGSPKQQRFWQNTIRLNSTFSKYWEILVVWSVTLSIFLETWVFFFTNNKATTGFYFEGWGAFYLAFSIMIDVVAISDIVVTLRTEVVTKDGHLTKFSKLLKNYRASWNLYYDIFAILPLDLMAIFVKGPMRWKTVGYARLNRLIWMRKVYLFFNKKEDDVTANRYMYRTAKCIYFLIYSMHCFAGLLYISACAVLRCHENTWAWDASLKANKSNFFHYMYSVYFSISTMTTVGYGDIVPLTMKTRVSASIVSVLGPLVFNYVSVQMYAAFANKDATRIIFEDILSAMRLFMKQHNLSESQQKRVNKYMSLLWTKYKKGFINVCDIVGLFIFNFIRGEAYPTGPFLMHNLPVELQKTVLQTERGKLLANIHCFRKAGEDFVRDLASVSLMYYFPRGEIIQYSGTITRELFCIHKGTCQIVSHDFSDIVGLYEDGMYFGEECFLFGKPALKTMRAKTSCAVLVIDFKKVESIFEKYPVIKRQIEELQINSEYYNSLARTVENMMSTKCRKFENALLEENDVYLTLNGRRFFRRSKCYTEDFENFPVYAGADEDTDEGRLRKLYFSECVPLHPSTLKERIFFFFFVSCPSVILMRNAILPNNQYYKKWKLFRIFVAVSISVTSSTLFAFLHYSVELWMVSFFLLFFCWIDIYIRLHVAFYNKGKLTFNTLETAKHYVKRSFLFDLISCFPWEIIMWMAISPSSPGFFTSSEVLHLYAYMRIPHVLQLYRVPFIFSVWLSSILAKRAIATLVQFSLYTFLFLHLITCIIFGTACPVADLDGETFKYELPLIKHNCTELSWVSQLDYGNSFDFEKATFFDVYSVSMYFAIATMTGVGYGDIHPFLITTKCVLIIIMMMGILFCGWSSAIAGAFLDCADTSRTAFVEKLSSVRLFLKSQNITGDLYYKILKFYAFKWTHFKGIDQDKLFECLPSSLLGDISTMIYAELITKAFGLNIKNSSCIRCVDQDLTPLQRRLSGKLDEPIFHKTLSKETITCLESDGGFIRKLAGQIQPCFYIANDLICKRHDFGSKMYFINKGEVEVLSKSGNRVVVKLRAGQCFGESSVLSAEPRAATIRAATDCELHVLPKKGLDETLAYYPDIYKDLKEAAMKRQSESHRGVDIHLNMEKKSKKRRKEQETHEAVSLCTRIQIRLLKTSLYAVDKMISVHNKTVDQKNTVCVVYQYILCLLSIISLWAMSYMPCVLDLDRGLYLFTMITEYAQLIMIILKFHMSYNDSETDYKTVSWSYMKRKIGYGYDLLCCFPYGFLVLHQMYEKTPMEFLPTFVYVRTAHMLHILTEYIFLWKEEQSITTNLVFIRIVRCSLSVICFTQFASVLFVLFVRLYGTRSWINELELSYYYEVYIYAVYWVLATYTTTGYGDITATTMGEINFSIFVMIFSKIHLVYNLVLLSCARSNEQCFQIAYEEKLRIIKADMTDQNLPSTLQNRVIRFYNYRWMHTRGMKTESLFNDLPHCLKSDIYSRISLDFLKQNSMFRNLSDVFLRHLCAKMLYKMYSPGEAIVRKGDKGTGLYLVLSGLVNLCPDGTEGGVITTHSTGAILDPTVLKYGISKDTATAENCVTVLFLSKSSIEEVGSYYPKTYDKLLMNLTSL